MRSQAPRGRGVAVFRRVGQLGFLGVVLYVGLGRQLDLRVPTVDAICPFGALEGLWHLVTTGLYLGKVFPSNMVVGLALLLAVLVAAGAFCGWICPFGTFQEGLFALRRRLGLPALRLPPRVEKHLVHLRWVVLVVILALTVRAVEMVFADVCPFRTIFGWGWLFAPERSAWPAYAIAVALILAAFFVNRFSCRFLCPLGAVISLLSRASPTRIVRRPETCVDCRLCQSVCPMNLAPQERPAPSCIVCLECTRVCPQPGTLSLAFIRPRLLPERVSTWLPAGAVLVFVGVLVLGNTTGYLQTTGKSEAYFTAVTTGQQLEPEAIRGWMSVAEVCAATGIPVDYVYAAAGIPPGVPPDTPLRDMKALAGFETEDMRDLVEEYYREHPDMVFEPVLQNPAGTGAGRSAITGEGRGRNRAD